jgi:hypothetical protein
VKARLQAQAPTKDPEEGFDIGIRADAPVRVEVG